MIILLSMAVLCLSFECFAYSHEGLAIPIRAFRFHKGLGLNFQFLFLAWLGVGGDGCDRVEFVT